jgi:hypothetical protein
MDWLKKAGDATKRWEEEARNAKVARKENELSAASRGWTLPAVLRTYESGDKGEQAFAEEVPIFATHGYEPGMQSAEGSHLHAGRLLLTGGLSVFAGRKGIRSKGKLTVTFQRRAVSAGPQTDLADQLTKLAALRDQGILTEEEFQAKKTQLLK